MTVGPILALDLATNTGFAEGVPGERPTYGSIRLAPPGGSNPEAYEALHTFLSDRFALNRYRMIAFEAPASPSHMAGKTNAKTIRRLMGLAEITEWLCYRNGYFGGRVMEANVQDVRRFLLDARPGRGEGKTAVMAKLRSLGFDPKTDDAADALAVYLYAASVVASRK